jgi:hypothetical protein
VRLFWYSSCGTRELSVVTKFANYSLLALPFSVDYDLANRT